jgi:hypothetical protein
VDPRNIRKKERRKTLDASWGYFLKFIKNFGLFSEFKDGKV